jgi:hypothetical protein
MERTLSAPLRRVSETLHTTFHPSSRLAEVSSSSSSSSGSRSSGNTERSHSGSRSPQASPEADSSSQARLRRSPTSHEAEQVDESLVKGGADDEEMTSPAGSTQGALQRSALIAETGSSGGPSWADNEGVMDASSTGVRKRPRLDEAAMVSSRG